MKNILLKSDNMIHALNIMENNFTICMKAITEHDEEYEEVNNKITCKDCIKFINYCKKIKLTTIKN